MWDRCALQPLAGRRLPATAESEPGADFAATSLDRDLHLDFDLNRASIDDIHLSTALSTDAPSTNYGLHRHHGLQLQAFIEKILNADSEGRYKVITCGEEKHLAYNRGSCLLLDSKKTDREITRLMDEFLHPPSCP